MGSTLEMSSLLHISSYNPYHAKSKYIPDKISMKKEKRKPLHSL